MKYIGIILIITIITIMIGNAHAISVECGLDQNITYSETENYIKITEVNENNITVECNGQTEIIKEGYTSEIGNTGIFVNVEEISGLPEIEVYGLENPERYTTVFSESEGYQISPLLTYNISPYNQDFILDLFEIDIEPFTFIQEQYKNEINYSIIFSKDDVEKKYDYFEKTRITNDYDTDKEYNQSDLDEGEYEIQLNISYETLTETKQKTIVLGNLHIDNTPPTPEITNNTAIINQTNNMTIEVTFTEDTLFWDITSDGNDNGYNITQPTTTITIDRYGYHITGNSNSFDKQSNRPSYYTHIYQDLSQTLDEGYYYGSCEQYESTSSDSTTTPTSTSTESLSLITPFSDGMRQISINAYDSLWNKQATEIKFNIDFIDEPDECNIYQSFSRHWNYFYLPNFVLETIPMLNGNYTINNVMKSLGNNYESVYYYDEDNSEWHSYNPEREINDLEEFTANQNTPYWIYMKSAGILSIR